MTNTPPRLLTVALLEQLEEKLTEINAPVAQLWRPGLAEAEMDALTAEIGISLSIEAKIWWGWHDGVELGAARPWQRGIGGGWDALPLAVAVEDTARNRQIAVTIAAENPGFHHADWSDSWIALCGDVSHPRLACECAVPAGAPSPVHYYDVSGNMEPGRPKVGSVGELVHVWLDALEDGTWHIDPTTGQFALRDPTEDLGARSADIADLL
ncbi:MAG: hypothetical protein ABW167_19055 [Baekduia sp.]